jgi:hypothetical protein
MLVLPVNARIESIQSQRTSEVRRGRIRIFVLVRFMRNFWASPTLLRIVRTYETMCNGRMALAHGEREIAG